MTRPLSPLTRLARARAAAAPLACALAAAAVPAGAQPAVAPAASGAAAAAMPPAAAPAALPAAAPGPAAPGAAPGPAASGAAPLPAVGSADDALRWFVEKEAAGQGRVEVRLGSIDPRLQLAPCRRIEPFLPPGARLWGRSAIGVRCVDGAAWSVSLPVTVTVWGRALVAAAPLAAGATPQPADLRVQEIELTREPAAPLTDAAQVAGRVLNRPLAPGQPLRADMLRTATTIQAGDPVRVVLVGEGFAINADGQALAAAGEGQPLRVRTESGRVLAGTVRGRTVEVRL